MDVLIQTREYVNHHGGELAALWGDCRRSAEPWKSVFRPRLEAACNARRINKTYATLPNTINYDPNINNLGVMLIGDGIVPPDYVTQEKERLTAPGTAKDWQKRKESGEIVLKPMTVMNMEAKVTPGFYSPRPVGPTYYMRVNADKVMGNVSQPGVCRAEMFAVPELEMDVAGQSINAVFQRLYNVTPLPPDKRAAKLAMDLVRDSFHSVPVNSGLVTTVVAEANSQTWDVLTELGEMPETIKMIINGIIQGIKLLLRAKKEIKQNLSSGSIGKDAASIWMMYRYGLMPIIYSVNDALDYLSLEARSFQSFRGRSDTPFVLDDIGAFKYVGNNATYEERCFLKYGYDLESKATGLKLNIASTAWELVPLSFVFDWFFQVGDTLTALSVPKNVNRVACSFSVRERSEHVWYNPHSHSTITVKADNYRTHPIDPELFIGLNSDVFIGFKRKMDALSLFWLMFKKNPSKRG